MRTTLRIDDDLFETIRTRAHEQRVPITRLVNRVLRRGLDPVKERESPPVPYRERVFNMGEPLFNVDKANAFAAALEDEEIIKKMRQGK